MCVDVCISYVRWDSFYQTHKTLLRYKVDKIIGGCNTSAQNFETQIEFQKPEILRTCLLIYSYYDTVRKTSA